MIKSVTINNFKGLEKLKLDNLGAINLLGGRNNAGKTTILEALFLFCDRLNPNMLLRQYNWRGVEELAISADALFAPLFYNFDLNKKIEIDVTDHRQFVESMLIKYKEGGNRTVKMQGNEGQIRTDENLVPLHTLQMKYKSSRYKEQEVNLVIDNTGMGMEAVHARPYEKKAAFLASKVHANPSENAQRFGELDIRGEADVIVDFLRIIEPRLQGLTSITLSNNTSMLYGNIGIGKKVPISYMGDGISRLLTILLAIVSNKDGILFIDEIENGIHYSVINKVWEIISKAAMDYNCQIFATTHSYECLDAALRGIREESKPDFRYFRIERSKDNNELIPKIFNYEVLEAAIDRGWEVR